MVAENNLQPDEIGYQLVANITGDKVYMKLSKNGHDYEFDIEKQKIFKDKAECRGQDTFTRAMAKVQIKKYFIDHRALIKNAFEVDREQKLDKIEQQIFMNENSERVYSKALIDIVHVNSSHRHIKTVSIRVLGNDEKKGLQENIDSLGPKSVVVSLYAVNNKLHHQFLISGENYRDIAHMCNTLCRGFVRSIDATCKSINEKKFINLPHYLATSHR